MKYQSFMGGVAVLFVGGAIAKILGAVYRIPLTWILGAEGLGIYQLVFPVFSLLIVLASSGMPTSISKMTATRLARHDYAGVRVVFRVSIITMLIVGVVVSALVLGLASVIANMQGNALSTLGYVGIAPAILFVCLLSVFRGYFQGHSNMIPTAVSQIVEQAGKLIFGLLFAYLFVGYGIEYGAFGAILGVTLSEIIAVAVLYIIYLKNRQPAPNYAQNGLQSTLHSTMQLDSIQTQAAGKRDLGDKSTLKSTFRELISTSTPIVLSSVTLPLLVMLDSFLVVNLLARAGFDSTSATILWGIDSGAVNSLINMPIALCLAVAVSVVPAVAALNDRAEINSKINKALTLTFVFCLPVIAVFLVLPEILTDILYQGSLGGAEYLRIASNLLLLGTPTILAGSVLQVQNSALQALGKGGITMLNMLLAGAVKITLTLSLVPMPSINIYGIALSSLAFYVVAVVLNAVYLRKKFSFRFGFKSVLPSIAGAGILLLFFANLTLLPISHILIAALAVTVGIVLYLFTLWAFGFNFAEIFSNFWRKRVKKVDLGNTPSGVGK